MRRHLLAFTMQGEDLAQPTNTVDLDPSVRDARGVPVARITYRPHRHELVASAHHRSQLVRVFEEMGATGTGVVTIPSAAGSPGWEGVRSVAPDSHHVMGTTRMGNDPRTSVTDAFGRLHDLDNVVVADSSVFVTSSGYGPTLTLVALAMRAAEALSGSHGAGSHGAQSHGAQSHGTGSDAIEGGAVE